MSSQTPKKERAGMEKCPYCGSNELSVIHIDAVLDFEKPLDEQAFGNFPVCFSCNKIIDTRHAEAENDNLP